MQIMDHFQEANHYIQTCICIFQPYQLVAARKIAPKFFFSLVEVKI